MSDMPNDRDPLLDVFIFETNQLLEQLEEILLDIEKSSDISEEYINEIFRIMHTIKGSAAMMMFEDVSKVAHKIEDMFFIIRENKTAGDEFSNICDVVFEGTDFIKSQMELIEAGEDADADSTELIGKIQKIISRLNGEATAEDEAEQKAEAAPQQPQEAQEPAAQSSEDAQSAQSSPSEESTQTDGADSSDAEAVGENKFRIKVQFENDCKMENVRAFSLINELSKSVVQIYSRPAELFEDPDAAQYIAVNGLELYITCNCTKEVLEKLISHQICVFDHEIFEVDDIEPFIADLKTQKAEEEAAGAQEASEVEAVPPQQSAEAETAVQEPENQTETEPQKAQSEPAKEEAAPQPQKQDAPAAPKKPAPPANSSSARAKGANHKQSIINVNVDKLDVLMDLVGEIVITEAMVTHDPQIRALELTAFNKNIDQLKKLTKEMQDVVMSIRMIPIAGVFNKMNRIVRDMSKNLKKDVELVIKGEETEIDKTIIDNLSDPLMHLVRNCMDHGIEVPEDRKKAGKNPTGTVTLNAFNNGSNIVVTISDDGRGLNKEKILKKAIDKGLLPEGTTDISDKKLYSCVLMPGFSTKEVVTEYSGRGVGMDVVKEHIEQIGGTISINSKQGEGTTFTIKIPLTLAIIDGMNVKVGDSSFIIPIASINESFKAKNEDISTDPYGNEMIFIRGVCHNVIRLQKLYGIENAAVNIEDGILIAISGNACVFVDKIESEQQAVIKPIPKYLHSQMEDDIAMSGCTVLGDGSIGFILNTNELVGR